MNGLYAVLITVGILLLIGCIRVGVQVEYCEQGLFVRIRAGRFYFLVFPVSKGKEKPKKVKAATEQTPAAKPKKGGLLQLALKFIPLVLDTAKRLFGKLRVDKLEMQLVVCAADPADAAIRYGQANALLGSLWQPMVDTFHVKDGHAHVGVDFESTQSTLYLLATLSLTIAQVLGLALVFGVRALGILLGARKNKTTQTQQGEAV